MNGCSVPLYGLLASELFNDAILGPELKSGERMEHPLTKLSHVLESFSGL